VARGELVLQQRRAGLEMWAANQRVARSIEWRGLESFVRCVPDAQRHARKARRDGRASLALAIVGGSLGVASLGSLSGLADEAHRLDWLGAAAGAAALGAVAGPAFGLAKRTLHPSEFVLASGAAHAPFGIWLIQCRHRPTPPSACAVVR
jgi:hypothetical protein